MLGSKWIQGWMVVFRKMMVWSMDEPTDMPDSNMHPLSFSMHFCLAKIIIYKLGKSTQAYICRNYCMLVYVPRKFEASELHLLKLDLVVQSNHLLIP